jgi:hypothetical protein
LSKANPRKRGDRQQHVCARLQFPLVTGTRFELGSWFDKLIAMNRGYAIMLRGRAACSPPWRL